MEFGFNSGCCCEEDRISAVAASTNSMSVGRSVITRLAGAGPPTGARPRDVITSLAAAGAADRHSSRRRFQMATSASGHYRVRRTAGSNRTIVVVVVVHLMKSDAPRTNPPPRPETTLQSTWEVIRWRTQDFKLKGH